MSDSSVESQQVRRCLECGTLFEFDVADPSPTDEPRCPQCGLWNSEPGGEARDEFVVRKTTKFR